MEPDPLAALLSFLPACLATALVCTAVKEDDPMRVLRGTLHLFFMIALGVAVFCVLVQVLTWLP